jgi:hypothetical protein
MPTYEIEQAVGSRARWYYQAESDWGVASGLTTYKQLPLVVGESLVQNIAEYESNIVRPSRSSVASQRGTHSPGGDMLFELANVGCTELWYNCLGGTPSGSGTGTNLITMKGSDALPEGFRLERYFSDIPLAHQFTGCKVNRITLNSTVNAVASGSANIMARTMAVSSTSMTSGGSVTDLIPSTPYTCQSMTISEGSTLAALGNCQSCTLTIDNRINGDNFVLGSAYRANLKPGKRMVEINAVLLFADDVLLAKARNGTSTKLLMIFSDGTYQFQVLIPNLQWYESGGTPTVSTDQGLTANLRGRGFYDASNDSDIVVTSYSTQTVSQLTA